MPLYDFYCESCKKTVEIYAGMSEKKPLSCKECGCKNCLIRDYSGIGTIIDSTKPKTLGALADKNTERLIKEGLADKKVLEWENKKKEKNKQVSKMHDIASMTPTQKRNYIMTGRKNG